MNRLPIRAALCIGAAALLALFAAACGSSDDAPAGAETMSFKITDQGCEPHDARAKAGRIEFEVEGESSKVTELEILDGETILGEKEDITEGLDGSFALTLKQGQYTIRCNGASDEDGALTVTGKPAGEDTRGSG